MRFADARYHHRVFQSSCLEIDYVSSAKPLKHAPVCDVEWHFNSWHADRPVGALNGIIQDGDRTWTLCINSLNAPPCVDVSCWGNQFIMITIQLV